MRKGYFLIHLTIIYSNKKEFSALTNRIRIPNVKFLKVNILESPENRKIAIDSGVMGTPTIKVFCEGRPIGELVGFKPLEKLVTELNEILNQKDSCIDQSTPLED